VVFVASVQTDLIHPELVMDQDNLQQGEKACKNAVLTEF
jgi:hypothetical protein